MSNEFPLHQHSAHCESGVMSILMRHAGVNISEPMAFGLSSALNFAYLPFVRVNGQPLIAYRMPPKFIIKKLCKRLGAKLVVEKFKNPTVGQQALDHHLNEGRLVGLQTSVYWLPYFPDEMRFHFNAHNLLVYGKEQGDYLISDPVIEQPVVCDEMSLQKARFAKGTLAPKGTLYYISDVPKVTDLKPHILESIKDTTRIIDALPIPIAGVRGIRFMANKIAKLSASKEKHHKNSLFLGHIIRMQEEIGTGGAGFRFIYASFLQEAAEQLQSEVLSKISDQMTDAGDLWRVFAMNTVKYCKGRGSVDLTELADNLSDCADAEQAVINNLKQFLKLYS